MQGIMVLIGLGYVWMAVSAYAWDHYVTAKELKDAEQKDEKKDED